MITAYRISGEATVLAAEDIAAGLDSDIVWIDLTAPSRAEEEAIETALKISVPTREDLKDIEPSSRLFVENGGIFMTASLVWKTETDFPDLTDIAFILTGERLLTVRYAEPRAFKLFAAALSRFCQNGHGPEGEGARRITASHLLVRLIETISDRTAEILEQETARIDALSLQVFSNQGKRRPPRYLEDRLIDVAAHHRLLGKVRESLSSIARLVSFLQSLPVIQGDDETRNLSHTIARDIQSLSEHVSFIAGNITFLLDASLGLISVEQNAIIKIFSIASVVFLPPTLVASVYGMNFQFMPELGWSFGYPMSLVAMLVSAIVPYIFFRWKGWL